HLAAGFLVDGDEGVVERAGHHESVSDGDATILRTVSRSAGRVARILVNPERLAGRTVDRVDPGVRGRDVDDAVDDDGSRLQSHLVVAGLEDPGRGELLHVGSVDLVERAIAPGE